VKLIRITIVLRIWYNIAFGDDIMQKEKTIM